MHLQVSRVMRASPTMTAGGADDYDFSISAVPAAGSVTLNNDMMMINISRFYQVKLLWLALMVVALPFYV